MGRTLLIIAAVAVIFLILKQLLSKRKPKQKPVDFDAMVRCEHCGTHVPRSTAITHGEQFYCSVKHLSADHPE